jgi:HKD family nuclease
MGYELAHLLASETKIQALIDLFRPLDQKVVTGAQLIQQLERCDLSWEEAEAVVYVLMDEGHFEVEKAGKRIGSYIFAVQPTIQLYLLAQKAGVKVVKGVATPSAAEDHELLVTYPNDKKFVRIDELRLLFPNLKRLIRSAEKELLIINPFFDAAGIERIINDLLGAASSGVKTKIVVREYGQHETLTECVDTIIDNFISNGSARLLQVRDYYKKLDHQIYAIHSKIIIADSAKCYVGSANLTMSSFYSNLELGVLLKGRTVRPVRSLFENLWKISTPIFPAGG